MTGRPSKSPNPDLASRVEAARIAHRMSLRAIASQLGVHPSTLSRFLKAKAFSEDVARIVETALPDVSKLPAVGRGTVPEATETTTEIKQTVLQLLQKAVTLLQPTVGTVETHDVGAS